MRGRYIIKTLVLITTMVLSTFFCAAQQSKAEVEADTLVAQQEYSKALDIYSKLIGKSKMKTEEDFQLYYKRSVCYYGLENYTAALADINVVIEKFPQPQAKLLRAYINQELGDYDALLDDLNEIIALNPGSPELIQWRASVNMEAGNYPEARQDIATLLNYQSLPELKAMLGLSYYYQEDSDSAIVIFDELLRENPAYLQGYIYAASLSLDEEAYELALSYINKGLEQDPGNATLIFYKGIALIETEQEKEGCRCLTQAFNAGVDDVADYLKQYCYQ